jgi:hypothetical protein
MASANAEGTRGPMSIYFRPVRRPPIRQCYLSVHPVGRGVYRCTRLFCTGEGLGVAWPGAELAIVAFMALVLATALAAVALLNRRDAAVSPLRR